MNIQGSIKSFQSLTTQEKQEKLVVVLNELKDSNQVFSSLLAKVSNTIPNDATLIVMYYDIMMFWQAIEEYNKTKDITSLSKAEEYMQALLKREQQDRLTDEKDIEKMEDLLQNI